MQTGEGDMGKTSETGKQGRQDVKRQEAKAGRWVWEGGEDLYTGRRPVANRKT